ncbi:vesicular glutamate transporter 3 [Plakobranchus ocellatus]|uniref:Vesicular glutamate transporter 3 n=1 Tax=Plakobranchus ocellatus TaxID=259542 RepID=A0AAV4AYG6_9GAST|nr:vesicular glutamate transporter 3 [Plakobranchus ocellatus]
MPANELNSPTRAQKGGQRSPIKGSGDLPKVSSGVSKQGSRPRLEANASTASMRRRNYARRTSSAFSFPHVDSTLSVPSVLLDEIDLDKVPWWTSHRLRLAVLSFLGFVCLYAQRVNLSIAIVSMNDHSYHGDDLSAMTNSSNTTTYSSIYSQNASTVTIATTTTTEAPQPKCKEVDKEDSKGEFNWDKELEGLILGAFFWGYLVFQVPGGRLSEKIGAKRVIAYAMFPVAILNIISPFAARASPYLFLVVRVFVGLGEVN